MNISKIVLLVSAVTMSSAYAADGTINFTGDITTNTCSINNGNPNKTVNLGAGPASALKGLGQTASSQNFSIELTGCTGSAVSVAIRCGSLGLASSTGRLKLDPASTAENIEITLYDANGVAQRINGVIPAESYIDITTGNATLNYITSYYAIGDVTAGTANSSVSYTLFYQ